jgi:hypothetical protein
MYKCPICTVWPSSHSLIKVGEKNGILYYYTCPAQAIMYYDVKGIINHYAGVLSEIPENKEWIWIFDSEGFGLTHAMQTNVAIELTRLISTKFSKNLKKIIIINPSFYVTMSHQIILPFLNKKLKDSIEINYELKTVEEILVI